MISWGTASELDRVDAQRGAAEWVAGLWQSVDAQLLTLDSTGKFGTTEGGAALRLEAPSGDFDGQQHRLLGLLHGAPVFAVEGTPSGEVHDFRQVGGQLSESDRDITAAATALNHWHRMEPRCPTCGELTTIINGGFARHCPTCGHDHFPRTDPAVIVAVLDDRDRILLGSQVTWPERRVSVLAGFVEAGESLEQAVHREIGEEVGVPLNAVRYFDSQPWPFPRSLMLGYVARASDTEITVDGEEIAFAAWFSRDEVREQVADGTLILPGSSSIAFRMIEAWLADDLRV